ncbi:MAG TPA: bifunctional 4-hydroxy-2-oxoglutarate aldolase/2-dehydro-3-deoxy-phosphogluconate aldolase [Acidimicrobiia bacterium]
MLVAAHPKARILARISADGVVPVFYDGDIDLTKEVASRLVAGGLSTLEFTNRGDGAVAVFAQLVQWAHLELPALAIGMGSVIEAGTAGQAIDAGADFVFAPSLSAEVAAVCHARNVPYIPGCGTVTEILAAYRLGCDLVKLFPAGSLGGPTFLSSIRAPCPWIQAVPTGGVEPTVDSMKAWFDAGAPAVGMGSKLLPPQMIADEDWSGLQERIVATVAAVKTARAGE